MQGFQKYSDVIGIIVSGISRLWLQIQVCYDVDLLMKMWIDDVDDAYNIIFCLGGDYMGVFCYWVFHHFVFIYSRHV